MVPEKTPCHVVSTDNLLVLVLFYLSVQLMVELTKLVFSTLFAALSSEVTISIGLANSTLPKLCGVVSMEASGKQELP
jgi:hypothetical protein